MSETFRPRAFASAVVCWVAVLPCEGAVSANLLRNPSFEEGVDERGVPDGWSLYGGGPRRAQSSRGKELRIGPSRIAESGRKAILIRDTDPTREIGITQTVPCRSGLTYELSAMVRAVPDASGQGAYLQLRFLPSNKLAQTGLSASSAEKFEVVRVRAAAPPGTRSATVYLYTHRAPTPSVIVDSVRLVSGVQAPPSAPPPAVPPVYTKLKNLHTTTGLVKDGRPNATIIVPRTGIYARQAVRIQRAVEKLSGVRLPIATDDSPAGSVPWSGRRTGNLIALGNRSTNRTISELYNRYYTLLDLRYPGTGGYVVRTLHSPFGDGRNVLFVGGSDLGGVAAATDVLVRKLGRPRGERGSLSTAPLAEIRLGEGLQVPEDVRGFETWEASKGYGSVGYFGWNSISKRMAMYYMTGEASHAREFLRLAFPDEKARKEIAEIDGERIENKDEPLSGAYHYNSHMMILFWDLIEESPVFSDEDRLRVTNAFSKQLDHRKGERIYGRTAKPSAVGSRHGQWSAVSLYCLGRYFQKDYPDPIWQHCVESARLHFASLHDYAWVGGEGDNLFWYNTGVAPIFTYLLLTGDRKPVENGVLATLLRGQEILISGRERDGALRSASIGYLHKAAYLMQDGRYVLYRQRTGVDTDVFRVGQSFWPEKHLAPKPPDDLVGRWTIHGLSEPMWRARRNGLKLEESFQFGSYRSSTGASGDFVLIDGFNGASRNPYHTFAILELRLDGRTLLKGYRNQVLTRADGLVEPKIAMNAALRYRDVIGPTAVAVGEVPDAAYCSWRRVLLQRTGRYALIVDDLAFRTDSDNMEVQINWETPRTARRTISARGVVGLSRVGEGKPSPGWHRTRALDCPCTTNLRGPRSIARLDGLGIALLRSTGPGYWIEMPFRLDREIVGEVFVELLNYRDRGVVRMFLDGELVGREYNHYAEDARTESVSLGRQRLAAGEHRLRVETVAPRPGVGSCYVGLTGVSIRADTAAATPRAPAFSICLSDPAKTTVRGALTTMEWLGPAKEGRHQVFFSVIARSPDDPGASPACVRVADNAAALALPTPALAVVGEHSGIKGELVLLAQDHLFGKGLKTAGLGGGLMAASAAVDLDWDFAAGRMELVAEKRTALSLSLTSGADVRVDGRRVDSIQKDAGVFVLRLEAGRHVVENLPAPARLDGLSRRLETLLAKGREERLKRSAAIGAGPPPKAPPLGVAFTANVGGPVVDLITIPAGRGRLVCAAEGKSVHLISTDGRVTRTLQADGAVRMMRWWSEHNLLLVGCADEQVIAFDTAGRRRWAFTSVMDPAVFRAAKTYWFKSARGHEGIHGLHTGVFLNGKSQAFVGSACTLEILDEHGELIKRMPQFWGKVSTFAIVDGPDGSLNLLASRKYSGTNRVAIINNRTLNPRPRGFRSVPPGHSYVGGWSSMNRHHLFYEDLDGDGTKEVTSEINGTWNRVTVWTVTGKALYDASFGPGERIPAKTMRDIDVADLDGDGEKEIAVATSSGLVVTLDRRCRKVWARRLESPPTVLKCVGAKDGRTPWIAIGCEDGSVVVLDGEGAVIRLGRVSGAATCIEALGTDTQRPTVLVASRRGGIKGFRLAE